MKKQTKTAKSVTEHLDEFGIEFGKRYRDRASGFEGQCVSLYFFEHGCLRVCLRGANRQSGEAVECVFDAPELIEVTTDTPVPQGSRRGGPHDLTPAARTGIR